MKLLPFMLFLLFSPNKTQWGFYAHKQINRMAVFTLPPQLFGFYKANIDFITNEATTPDKRRYAVEAEGRRHFIDLDYYDSLPPQSYKKAVKKYSVDTLNKYGTLPYHLIILKKQLTKAFLQKDRRKILRLSTDAGHYLADANVPLHTTINYNGQFTGQEGIHGLWESRIPELFAASYNKITGKSVYIGNFKQKIWQVIYASHNAVDSVLNIEKTLSKSFDKNKEYTFEERGNSIVKTYSYAYAEKYHLALNGQVERQFRKAIELTGSFWYTCWIDAGQPKLDSKRVPYKKGKSQKYRKEQK